MKALERNGENAMICYRILDETEEAGLDTIDKIRQAEKQKLEKLIKGFANSATFDWLVEAETRTAKYRQDQKYTEPPKGNWTLVKEVYKRLQANKCAYCEQKLEDRGIAHDVEHYRPKKNVRIWLNKKRKNALGFAFVDEESEGYFKLPYNIFNYITSCKVCNSTLKRDYFPVADARRHDAEDFDALGLEKPFLPYTLGSIDEDRAEDLISFSGYLPVVNPTLTDQHKINRALVTIKFFELEIRPYLIKQRCEVIKSIFEAIQTISETQNAQRKKQAEKDLVRLQEPTSEHSSCARSFFNLCLEDDNKAFDLYEKAVEYIEKNPQT